MNENEILSAIQKLPVHQREAFLDQVCGGDERLRQHIREMLHFHEAVSDATVDWDPSRAEQESGQDAAFLTENIDFRGSALRKLAKADIECFAGDLIGPYTLIKPLGQGGMGEVWLAEQSEPVKRQVALKVIKRGIGSKEILARFEAERQALSLMNHPNIARILDAGATPDGHPYFAMELVTGRPLTTYCDENRLSINERLALFADVCNGVQHAHQKGIIHRDLKPGNILVGVIDGKPVAKVIDFGLAKAMESTQRLTDQSLFTGIGQVLGTLKYMSPEQASLDAVDIDTRTDIYALGVILYELMTGTTPLDDSSIKGKAALMILAIIRDKEPVKPSSRLGSSTNEEKSSITNMRRTDGVRLNRVLAGDLDWIVMKALEKDRARRYGSASDFAADVHRYLNSEPVAARPPSLSYRVRKFLRKNRISVIVALFVVVALITGIAATSVAIYVTYRASASWSELVHLNGGIEAKLSRASEIQAVAKSRVLKAEQSLVSALHANEVLGSVFEGLDPNAQYRTAAELRNALLANVEEAVKELESSAIGDPVAIAAKQYTLASLLLGLGDVSKATPLFEQALQTNKISLGKHHLVTIRSMNGMAMAYLYAGQLDKALLLMEQTMQIRGLVLGPDHPETLRNMMELLSGYAIADRPERFDQLFPVTLMRWKKYLPSDSPQLADVLDQATLSLLKLKRPADAEPLLRESLSIRQTSEPDEWSTFNTQSMLGSVLLAQSAASTDDAQKAGFLAEAEPLLVAGYEGMKQREAAIPPQAVIRIPEALDRLIELYTIQNKPDDVKKYSDLRAAYPKVEEAK